MANHLLRLGILAKLFFYHSSWELWMAFVGGAAGLLLALTKLIDMGDWEPFFVVAGSALFGGTLMIYLLISLMMFPAQILAFASSRQYGRLPHIRRYLACLMVVFLLLLQLLVFLFLKYDHRVDGAVQLSLIVAIMLVISLGMALISFADLDSMQVLYFFALPVLGWFLVPQLKLLPNTALVIMLLVVWSVFLVWWFSWHPKKYQKNPFVMNSGDFQKHIDLHWSFYTRTSVPDSLVAGLLFGQMGHGFYMARLILSILVVPWIIVVPIMLFVSHNIGAGFMFGLKLGAVGQIVLLGSNYSMALFKNIHKAWLCVYLERQHLLPAIEKIVWSLYFKNIVVVAFIAGFAAVFVPEFFLPLAIVIMAVALSLLITATTLYTVFITYAKWPGNLKVFYWLTGISTVPIVALGAGFMWLKLNSQIEFVDYPVQFLVSVLLLVCVVLLMRNYVVRLWQKVDLVRVA